MLGTQTAELHASRLPDCLWAVLVPDPVKRDRRTRPRCMVRCICDSAAGKSPFWRGLSSPFFYRCRCRKVSLPDACAPVGRWKAEGFTHSPGYRCRLSYKDYGGGRAFVLGFTRVLAHAGHCPCQKRS